ncbi:MAG: YceI family protein [Candidatus Woesearchaeota archaeon]
MNKILWIIVVLSLFLFACTTQRPEYSRAEIFWDSYSQEFEQTVSVPINRSRSYIEFEGFGIGRSHVGTFDLWQGALLLYEYDIVGVNGIIHAYTAKTEYPALDTALRGFSFFHTEDNPYITFNATYLTNESMVGTLTLRGVSKNISFPATVSGYVYAEFVLNISEFGIFYAGVDEDVRITFSLMP